MKTPSSYNDQKALALQEDGMINIFYYWLGNSEESEDTPLNIFPESINPSSGSFSFSSDQTVLAVHDEGLINITLNTV